MSDIVKILRRLEATLLDEWSDNPSVVAGIAADEIERLRAALLEIFDHECRTSGKSFIACTARDALWPGTALAGEKKDGS